jgi:NAD(P)-dependent dehydrogenase (short-subunit alcohol dehydrogenase family)
MNPVASSVALITGGQGALASAIHHELESSGWTVFSPGHSDMDVTQSSQVEQYVSSLPRLDMLIHAAGHTSDQLMLRMSEGEFDEILAVNLKGAFFCSQAALKRMVRQNEGHIVHIGSFSAIRPPHGQANYASAKAGLIGLTQSIAQEYGKRGVRANCVLPGFLDTPMTKSLLEDDSRRQAVLQSHTLGRLNTIQDAARFIAFLHTMRHVSGQTFQLDSRVSAWA